jgi:hypothetical protein
MTGMSTLQLMRQVPRHPILSVALEGEHCLLMTTSVAALAASPEVPGSIPGATRFSE